MSSRRWAAIGVALFSCTAYGPSEDTDTCAPEVQRDNVFGVCVGDCGFGEQPAQCRGGRLTSLAIDMPLDSSGRGVLRNTLCIDCPCGLLRVTQWSEGGVDAALSYGGIQYGDCANVGVGGGYNMQVIAQIEGVAPGRYPVSIFLEYAPEALLEHVASQPPGTPPISEDWLTPWVAELPLILTVSAD